jgi:hypothetical protein
MLLGAGADVDATDRVRNPGSYSGVEGGVDLLARASIEPSLWGQLMLLHMFASLQRQKTIHPLTSWSLSCTLAGRLDAAARGERLWNLSYSWVDAHESRQSPKLASLLLRFAACYRLSHPELASQQ